MDLSSLEGPPIYDPRFTIRPHHRNLPRIRLDRCVPQTSTTSSNGLSASRNKQQNNLSTSSLHHDSGFNCGSGNRTYARPRSMLEEVGSSRSSPITGHPSPSPSSSIMSVSSSSYTTNLSQPGSPSSVFQESTPPPPNSHSHSHHLSVPTTTTTTTATRQRPQSISYIQQRRNPYQLIWLEEQKMWVRFNMQDQDQDQEEDQELQEQQLQPTRPRSCLDLPLSSEWEVVQSPVQVQQRPRSDLWLAPASVVAESPPAYESVFQVQRRQSIRGSRWMAVARRVQWRGETTRHLNGMGCL